MNAVQPLALQPTPIPGGPVLEDHMRLPLATFTAADTAVTYQRENRTDHGYPLDVSKTTTPRTFTADVFASVPFGHKQVSSGLVPVTGGFDDALRAARDLINTGDAAGVAVMEPTRGTYALLKAKEAAQQLASTGPSSTTSVMLTKDEISRIAKGSTYQFVENFQPVTEYSDKELVKVTPGSSFVSAIVTSAGYFDLRAGAALISQEAVA